MSWAWPLRSDVRFNISFGHPARFGAIRKFDIHTGIDLYCYPDDEVLAVENGTVIRIEDFTGTRAGSPWWHDTQAVLVHGDSGIVCYGEINPSVEIGQVLTQGDIVGTVKTVLKKNKGLPMTMLHLELYDHDATETVTWHLDEEQPKTLLDPTNFLKDI